MEKNITYYQRHKEKCIEYGKEYYINNKEKINNYSNLYYFLNKEKILKKREKKIKKQKEIINVEKIKLVFD